MIQTVEKREAAILPFSFPLPLFIYHHLPHPTLMNARCSRQQIRVRYSSHLAAMTLNRRSAASVTTHPCPHTSIVPQQQHFHGRSSSVCPRHAGTGTLIHMQTHTHKGMEPCKNSPTDLICIRIHMHGGVNTRGDIFKRKKGETSQERYIQLTSSFG